MVSSALLKSRVAVNLSALNQLGKPIAVLPEAKICSLPRVTREAEYKNKRTRRNTDNQQ